MRLDRLMVLFSVVKLMMMMRVVCRLLLLLFWRLVQIEFKREWIFLVVTVGIGWIWRGLWIGMHLEEEGEKGGMDKEEGGEGE